ncbi:MAG: hypothetical protein IJK01_00830 [Clostridia bacterium]|nr:hypothetical protein [Clostridia bacterium]
MDQAVGIFNIGIADEKKGNVLRFSADVRTAVRGNDRRRRSLYYASDRGNHPIRRDNRRNNPAPSVFIWPCCRIDRAEGVAPTVEKTRTEEHLYDCRCFDKRANANAYGID